MPRTENPLDPAGGPLAAFANELRLLRRGAGDPPYRVLARRAGFSASTLSAAASGRSLPSLDVTLAYAQACGGDATHWRGRWHAVAGLLQPAQLTPRSPVPRQLPRAVPHLAGRGAEVARLTALLAADGADAGACVVVGAGGMGKTALAVYWATRNAHRFPHGQLFVNLRAHDPSDQPLTVGEALYGFLAALGFAPGAIPDGEQQRAALYRSLMADRRALVLLDDALDSDQAAALLPGGRGCAVIVTSRRRLEGLAALTGAAVLSLDPLPDDEAESLLARHIERDRLAREPDSRAELLRWCAGLPLALAITGARIIGRGSALADLADELRDEAGRLDALESADHSLSLRSILRCSRRALHPPAARAFALLGLVPGAEIGLAGAASLLALPTADARSLLRELESAHLLNRSHHGRYRMHDLVRLYAGECAQNEVPEHERAAARERLTGYFLHTAHAAESVLRPFSEEIRLGPAAVGSRPVPPADPAGALAWFETEHECLLALHRSLAAEGPREACWQLAWAMDTFHYRRAMRNESLEVWRAALGSAEQARDRAAQGLAHRHLGRTLSGAGRHGEAIGHLDRALALAVADDDAPAAAHTEINLAWARELAGEDLAALDHSSRSLEIFRSLGDSLREAVVLNAIGWYHTQLGRHQEAEACCRAALVLNREHGNRAAEASTLDSLGRIAYHLGCYEESAVRYRETIAIYHELGNEYSEADTVVRLGEAYEHCGRIDEAIIAWRWAYGLYHDQHRLEDAARVADSLERHAHP